MPTPDTQKRGIKLKKERIGAADANFQSWFFGIGINQYKDFTNLNNAVKDVEDICDLLTMQYDIDPSSTILLFNDEATRENIIDQLDDLSQKIKPEDKLIIYYSGHGHLDKRTEISYWIPFDGKKGKSAHYIRSSTIRDYIKAIPARHTLVISDSCFSGALFVRGVQRSATAIRELETRKSRWALCSGRHDEYVYDGNPGTNSPFAASILKILQNNPLLKINISKLADQVVELTRANYKQLPEGNPLFGVGHEGGQYIFNQTLNEEQTWNVCLEKDTKEAFLKYVALYPSGQYLAEANKKIAALTEVEEWEKASKEDTIPGYLAFDKAYPKSTFSPKVVKAIARLEELEEWENALRRNKISGYRTYLLHYPNGHYVNEAATKIDNLLEGNVERRVGTAIATLPKREDEKVRKPFWSIFTIKDIGLTLLIFFAIWNIWIFLIPTDEVEAPTSFLLEEEAFCQKMIPFDTIAVGQAVKKSPTIRPITPQLAMIPGGRFSMGYFKKRDGKTIETATPGRIIEVDTFLMAMHEVTNKEFVLFLNGLGIENVRNSKLYQENFDSARIVIRQDKFVVEYGFEDHPVVSVSWHGATAYAKWLSQLTGKRYRLPSEVEWEYVARGGGWEPEKATDLLYSGANELDQIGWYNNNAGNRSHPVGTKAANQLSVFDMSGNVWEWCADDWSERYDESHTTSKPWKAPQATGRKVVRGGSFNDSADFCRSAYRKSLDDTDSNKLTGFRLVVSRK